MSMQKLSFPKAQSLRMGELQAVVCADGAPHGENAATTPDVLERAAARRPSAQRWSPAGLDVPAAGRRTSRSCAPPPGVRVAAGLGALVGFGLPSAAGIVYLVPEPSWLNPSGEPAIGWAASLLLGGTIIGTGVGLVAGRWLGQVCCGAR